MTGLSWGKPRERGCVPANRCQGRRAVHGPFPKAGRSFTACGTQATGYSANSCVVLSWIARGRLTTFAFRLAIGVARARSDSSADLLPDRFPIFGGHFRGRSGVQPFQKQRFQVLRLTPLPVLPNQRPDILASAAVVTPG